MNVQRFLLLVEQLYEISRLEGTPIQVAHARPRILDHGMSDFDRRFALVLSEPVASTRVRDQKTAVTALPGHSKRACPDKRCLVNNGSS